MQDSVSYIYIYSVSYNQPIWATKSFPCHLLLLKWLISHKIESITAKQLLCSVRSIKEIAQYSKEDLCLIQVCIVHCESCFTCRPSSADQSRLSFAAAHTSADSRTGRGADNCCMLRRKNESPPHFIAPVHFLHIKLFGASSSYPTLPLLSWKRHSYSCAMCTFVRGSSVYCVLWSTRKLDQTWSKAANIIKLSQR